MEEAAFTVKSQCSSLIWEDSTALLYVVPVLSSLALLGNTIVLCVQMNSTIRSSCPTFAYLIALTCVDISRTLCIALNLLKKTLRSYPQVTHGYAATQVIRLTDVLEYVFHDVAFWYIALAVAVFSASKKRHNVPAWTRMSASRIVALLLFLSSAIVNFPRVFKHDVTEILDHCMEGRRLWRLEVSKFGQSDVYRLLISLVNLGLTFAVPALVLLLANCVLCVKLGCRRKNTTSEYTSVDEQVRSERGKFLQVFSFVFLFMEIPQFTVNILEILLPDTVASVTGWKHIKMAAVAVCLFRTALPFFLYVLLYGEFRKVFARTFCCARDEFYEPCACACLPCSNAGEQEEVKRKLKPSRRSLDQKQLVPTGSEQSGSSLGSSGWI